ncbi:MAG TPA: N-acetylmuramoyl-L-alanine amidase, partial [Pseudomonadales bacterium]|nr:N-acetylmuramoyl-L-alanine amidase [Pseudomonadales bacterium]
DEPVPTKPDTAKSAKAETSKAEIKTDKKADVAAKTEPLKADSNKAEAAKAVIEQAKSAESKSAPVLGLQDTPVGSGRPMIIAIDAGHGGDDPGAIGKRGTREKNVTLAIARKLYARMAAEPGIKPVMTRSGDYFVPLDRRRQIARDRYKADLFLSIHADSFPNGSAYGASVYAISRKGATSATAARLAESENRADLVGGVSSAGKDDLLKSVLVDLSMDGTMEHSLRVGRNVLGSLGAVGRLHRRNVEQAGFVVLKTPDMPSILVETGFISTPEEESKLNNPVYQEQLSNAITAGVRRYFASNPIPGSYFASLKKAPRQASVNAATKPLTVSEVGTVHSGPSKPASEQKTRHVISAGETLTSIAKKYRVSPAKIRARNGMKNDIVQVGRTIEIPKS